MIEIILKKNPSEQGAQDTYVNLLYKIAKKKKALEIGEISLRAAPENMELKQTLSKIKNGIPTWR